MNRLTLLGLKHPLCRQASGKLKQLPNKVAMKVHFIVRLLHAFHWNQVRVSIDERAELPMAQRSQGAGKGIKDGLLQAPDSSVSIN